MNGRARRSAALVGLGLGAAALLWPAPTSACSCSSDVRPYLYVGADHRIPASEAGIAVAELEFADLDPRRYRIEWLDDEGRWVEDTFSVHEIAPGLRELVPSEYRFRVSIRRHSPGERLTGVRSKVDAGGSSGAATRASSRAPARRANVWPNTQHDDVRPSAAGSLCGSGRPADRRLSATPPRRSPPMRDDAISPARLDLVLILY